MVKIQLTVEDEKYTTALKLLLEKMKDMLKDEKTEFVLDYNTNFKHEILFPSDSSKPKHRLSWLTK